MAALSLVDHHRVGRVVDVEDLEQAREVLETTPALPYPLGTGEPAA